jgi:superfamily II DNA or RNA helicase/very-short-patch-repair endonuclease
MPKNIDDLADELTSYETEAEKYHTRNLSGRPRPEWSPVIDTTAENIWHDVQISDSLLTKNDFGEELGAFYREGLLGAAGRYTDLPDVLGKQIDDEMLGTFAYQLNELNCEISAADLGVSDMQTATEAVVEKLLTRQFGEELSVSFELSSSQPADIASQLFNNQTVAENIDVLADAIDENTASGLLALLDRPQMMTRLWDHQRTALQGWYDQGMRGFVDMATATGKTVLGLAAIALVYGELHPNDQRVMGPEAGVDRGRNDDILIVAHNDLILQQWRREFEKHLNIPAERTSGSDDITLEWGTIHFRTPQTLVNQDRIAYELVLLDEAHHYATGAEWGSLLEEFDGYVLALSGSVDDAGASSQQIKERLENGIGPRVKRYTITEARADGVIPSFDWEIHYAAYDGADEEFQRTSTRAEAKFSWFQSRLRRGELELETDRRLATYDDVRNFSHTTEGKALKGSDEKFSELVTRLFSRHTKQWSLSPKLEAVTSLVQEHHTSQKVVVLADSKAQVEELCKRLEEAIERPGIVYQVTGELERSEQLSTIEAFDEPETGGILVGTGRLLGEGVDMRHASVAINMATGGVNQELVQRIGRVLRNPSTQPKHAMFYNVVGVPSSVESGVPREDGRRLIEQAAEFCALGRRFDKLPGFALSAGLEEPVVGEYLEAGGQAIAQLGGAEGYDWDEALAYRQDLVALTEAVENDAGDVETTLGRWEEYAWEHSEETPEIDSSELTPEEPPDGVKTDDETGDEAAAPTKDELLRSLSRLEAQLGKTPTKAEMQSEGEQAVGQFEEAFGSWSSALRVAGMSRASGSNSGYSREEIVGGIRAVTVEVDRKPTTNDIDVHAPFSSSAVYTHFDSLIDAREAAGVASVLEDTGEPAGTDAASGAGPSEADEEDNSHTEDDSQGREGDEQSEDRPTDEDSPPEDDPETAQTEDETTGHGIGAPTRMGGGIGEPTFSEASAAPSDREDESEPNTTGEEAGEEDQESTSAATGDRDEEDPEAEGAEAAPTDGEQTNDPVEDGGTVHETPDTVGDPATPRDVSADTDAEQPGSPGAPSVGGEQDEEGEPSDSNQPESMDARIDEWKSQLLDLTRRNALVSFTPTKSKSLPLAEAEPEIIAGRLDASSTLRLRKNHSEEPPDVDQLEPGEVLPTRPPDEAAHSLDAIRRNNKNYRRERGVDSLYLSLWELEWYSPGEQEQNRSPVFLAPVELEQRTIRDPEQHDYVVEPKSEGLRLNPALRKKLAAERELRLPDDEALSLESIDEAIASVREVIGGFDDWSLRAKAVLGIFDFAKFSLYTDLERNREAVKEDPIIRALNDDVSALNRLQSGSSAPSADELDSVVAPEESHQVLEADSSQQEAIEAAKRGTSFVLQGPPGTGKSQTIANIIAESIADGDRVLFVSEKQAALDVVKSRLEDVGLGRFCLEAHGRKASNSEVLAGLEPELQADFVEAPAERPGKLETLADRRESLNEYGELLFYSPDGWEMTAFDAFGIVSDHADLPGVSTTVSGPLDISEREYRAVRDEVATLGEFDEQIDSYDSGPWRHVTLGQWKLGTDESMRDSLRDQAEALRAIRSVAEELSAELGVDPGTLEEVSEALELVEHLMARPEIDWQSAMFEGSLADRQGRDRLHEFASIERERLAKRDQLLARYDRSFLSVDGAALFDELGEFGLLKLLQPSYRSLRRRITRHLQDGAGYGYDQLRTDTQKLAEIHRLEARSEDFESVRRELGPLFQGDDTDWKSLITAVEWLSDLDSIEASGDVERLLLEGTVPELEPLSRRARTRTATYEEAATYFEETMDTDRMRVGDQPLETAPLESLIGHLETLIEKVPLLQPRIQFADQHEQVSETFAEGFVEQFLTDGNPGDTLVESFERRFFTDWLNGLYEETDLGSFNAAELDRYLSEFRQIDVEQLALASIGVQHEVTRRRPSLQLEYATSSEQVLVRRETEKQRRHVPLRELFDQAGSFISRLTPCFMMSPISVAQYLKRDAIDFDTVIFDEASQIMPQDALSSLIRADQAIIAGDTKQLPPTSFFRSDVETTESVREDLDSILEETAAVLPEKQLRWHYRSRSEELIQFSNMRYYEGSLRTFPENEPETDTGVSFEYVPDGEYDRGGTRQNQVEAARVVDLIETHATEVPDKSLGVVAFSRAQEEAIREELESRRRRRSQLDAFVGRDGVLDEFFIKNLEMVQGDERDRMIFSVGYGPDANGKISTNFGPLNQSGGERRLNVAVTRAKEQVTVVCSMQPDEIDLTGSDSTGAKHFKQYLRYAAADSTVVQSDGEQPDESQYDSQFQRAVARTLEAEGYEVASQIERGGYSIDLAIRDPDNPETFLLGLECDGSAYRTSRTARDRDRTRQLMLESLGWAIHRVWAPDWASNRDKVLSEIEEKVQAVRRGENVSVEPTELETFEPELVASSSRFAVDNMSAFIAPSLRNGDEYDPNIKGNTRANRNSVRDAVFENGPLRQDDAIQTFLDVWAQSYAGSKVQRIFEDNKEKLIEKGELFERDGFLWPKREELDFQARVSTGSAERKVDEIALEEIALAMHIILTEGGSMERDDLSMETSQLFGYQRRGSRIQERLSETIDLLVELELVEESERLAVNEAKDAEERLLERIYG